MAKVSVLIPVYNVESYLDQCLTSVLGQTLKDIEVICVNDSSTDGSLEILNKYAKQDTRVQVVTQKNAGAGAARNRGLSMASGEYLSFLDADDFFEPDMLEKQYQMAEEDQADFVVCKSDQYHTEKKEYVQVSWVVREKELPPYHPFNYRQMTDNVFKVFVGWAWDKLYRRSFVEQYHLKFQEQRTSNDMLFVFSAIVMAKKIAIVPEILIHQRRDTKDSLSKTRENSWWCFYDALIALREKLIEEDKFWDNTLSEPTKSLLKEKLESEWFEKLGIKEKTGEYFYNKKEYQQYMEHFGTTR